MNEDFLRNVSLKRKASERELKVWNQALIETGNILAERHKSFFESVFKLWTVFFVYYF